MAGLKNYLNKSTLFLLVAICIIVLSNSNGVLAATTQYSDLFSWQAMVLGSELFETNANNLLLADEVNSLPGANAKLGPVLTFQSANTGLSRGFSLESTQAQGVTDPTNPMFEAGFTFDDHDSGIPVTDSANALSVGDTDDYEDDDWKLNLLGGATMSAFGIELRDNRFESGEYVELYWGSTLMDTVDLSPLASSISSTDFLGFTTDYLFDGVVFNEAATGDDIAIADFRFAAVAPEPVSSTLFIVGAAAFGMRRFWTRRTS